MIYVPHCFVFLGAYTFVDKDYRGQEIYQQVLENLYDHIIDIGNQGLLTSFSLTARSIVPSLKQNVQCTAIMPKSAKIPQIGWLPELIGFTDLRSKMTREEKEWVMSFFYCQHMPKELDVMFICAFTSVCLFGL